MAIVPCRDSLEFLLMNPLDLVWPMRWYTTCAIAWVCVSIVFVMTTAASDAQKVISAQVNKPFTIVLESNPTTGYSWQAEFDPEYLKLSQSRYERPSSSLLGAGGRQVFVFVPRRSGKTVIEMRYKRKWEPAPVKVKRFAVVVSHEGSFHGDGVRWTEIRNTDEEVCTCASGTYLLTKRDRFDRLYHSPGRIGLTLTPS